jgi:hypothetical protein
MPHANEAFSADDTQADSAKAAVRAGGLPRQPSRQQESETPNERAMRKATAARKSGETHKRQQG